MPRHVICPNCGARNAAGALWCGQCYRPFAQESEGTDAERPAPEITATADGQISMELPLPKAPRISEGTWVCSVCGTSNPLADSYCAACGSSIFEAFKREERRQVDPRSAVLRAVLLPGLGHAYAGQTLLGMSGGALAARSLLLGAVFIVLGFVAVGVLLVLVGVGVWGIGVLDAFRWARGETSEVVLRPRVLTALVGAVLLVLIIVAVSAQRAQR